MKKQTLKKLIVVLLAMVCLAGTLPTAAQSNYPAPIGKDQKVKIFAVMPDQSPQEALINRGIYFLDAGDDDRAREILKQAQQNSPSDPRISALLSTAEARKGDKSGH